MALASGKTSIVDDCYWLAHCEGYRVECPDGRVGTVLEVSRDAGETRAEEIVVGSGLLRRQLISVEPADVAEVSPHRLYLRLRHTPGGAAQPSPERTRRLVLRAAGLSR